MTLVSLSILASLLASTHVTAQTQQDNVVNGASAVLDEIMAVPAKQIPQSLLAKANGLALIPNVIKGGFVIGVRHGKGVMLIKDDAGNWLPPNFVSMTGGSVGWQAGLQATDVVLVFQTRKSVNDLMTGKLTIGVDAAAAAGPVGRQAAAATDVRLAAEIYSYSRSRGLFAGVSVDGSVLQIDNAASTAYYQGAAGQPGVMPESAMQLINRVARYSGSPQSGSVAQPQLSPQSQLQTPPQLQASQPSQVAPHSQMVQRQLVASWQQLSLVLDEQWNAFLTLPADVVGGAQNPKADELNTILQRYTSVATNPQYASLAQRHEFASTYQLLREYVTLQSTEAAKLTLPPPPSAGSAGVPHGRY